MEPREDKDGYSEILIIGGVQRTKPPPQQCWIVFEEVLHVDAGARSTLTITQKTKSKNTNKKKRYSAHRVRAVSDIPIFWVSFVVTCVYIVRVPAGWQAATVDGSLEPSLRHTKRSASGSAPMCPRGHARLYSHHTIYIIVYIYIFNKTTTIYNS